MATSVPTAVLGKSALVILTALTINWMYGNELSQFFPGQAVQCTVNITESEDDPREMNERPVIGVLVQRALFWRAALGDVLIFSAHVRWLQMGGANVVPIWVNQPPEYYERLIKKLNGIYIPGGGSHPTLSWYGETATTLFKLAIKLNDEGVHFPIWGTCLGFQYFLMEVSDEDVRYRCDELHKVSTFYTGKDFKGSFIDELPVDQKNVILTDKILPHFHRFCITREVFHSNKPLVDFFREVSVNVDVNGTEYVSTIQAKAYPFYATQWHPEKYSYHWTRLNPIPHANKAIKVGQAISNFFIGQARRNNQKFDSLAEEEASYIENYQLVFMGHPTFASFYFFKNETMEPEALVRRQEELIERRSHYKFGFKSKL